MGPSACKLFAGIDDPRVVGRTTHGLAEILFAALCATLCGFGCCDGYAQFARAKVDFLRRYLPYKDGTPSHDTFGRLFRLIRPEQFEAVLADLARRVTAGSAGQVAIDGKAVRGSADARRGIQALHLLHAFATDVGLCIGQVAVDGKSNEITALPELLGLLDLRGRYVTMDALHTQRASAKLLRAGRVSPPTSPGWPPINGPGWPPSAAWTAPASASGLVRQRRNASSTCLDTPMRPSACSPCRAVIGRSRTPCTGFST